MLLSASISAVWAVNCAKFQSIINNWGHAHCKQRYIKDTHCHYTVHLHLDQFSSQEYCINYLFFFHSHHFIFAAQYLPLDTFITHIITLGSLNDLTFSPRSVNCTCSSADDALILHHNTSPNDASVPTDRDLVTLAAPQHSVICYTFISALHPPLWRSLPSIPHCFHSPSLPLSLVGLSPIHRFLSLNEPPRDNCPSRGRANWHPCLLARHSVKPPVRFNRTSGCIRCQSSHRVRPNGCRDDWFQIEHLSVLQSTAMNTSDL